MPVVEATGFSADDMISAGYVPSVFEKTSLLPEKDSDDHPPSAKDLKSAGFVPSVVEKASLLVKAFPKGDSDDKPPSTGPSTEGSPQTQASGLTEPLAESSQLPQGTG